MDLSFCVLFFSILVTETLQVTKAFKESYSVLDRTKRQDNDPDEVWSWGIVSPASNLNLITKGPLTSTEAPTPKPANPCEQPLLVKPNFNRPGHRISETKCYEYIWDIKFREDRDKKQEECKKYTQLQEGYFTTAAVGGRNTAVGEFPHMAAIGWKAVVGTWFFKCGGSLISRNFVLTAAHCTRASELDTTVADVVPKIVRLGDKNIVDRVQKPKNKSQNTLYPTANVNDIDPIDVEISQIIVHPKYKAPTKYFDIALMKLLSEVEFSLLTQPVCLWTNFDTRALGSKATLTGWGVTESGSRTTSPELQAADVDVIDNQQCDTLLRPMRNRNWCGIQDHQICAGKMAGGVDACQGDSGGPLQVKIALPPSTNGTMHYVIGVTAFGFGCALENTPGVYTRVSSFVDWIEGIVWK